MPLSSSVAALAALPNLGPVSAGWLVAAGITGPEQLRARGAVTVFRQVAMHRAGDVSLNLLYAPIHLGGHFTEAAMTRSKPDDPTLSRIAAGRTDLVFDYVGAGHTSTARDGDGLSLLYWCARYGDVSAMRFLLAHGEHLDSIASMIGLEGAAYFGHWRLCEFLLENGADVNRPNPVTAETALHAALCTPNRPAFELVVRVLLAAGADPNRRTEPGVETGAFMRDCRTKGETTLHRAAAFAPMSTIQLLLDAGAARNVKDINGDSPLGWASWHRRPDAVLRLLTYEDFYVHPDRGSTFDHGMGWGAMEIDLLGRPLA